jgi:phosphoglycerate kinase
MQTEKVRIPVDSLGLKSDQSFGSAAFSDPVIVFGENIPEDSMGLDIGPLSSAAFAREIQEAGTILWNGPMGVFEDPRFAAGTEAIARAVAQAPGYSIVGGGDSVAAVQQFKLESEVDFVSTGGGASLELVEFGDLPGLRALCESKG